jgi:type I restriction enzyme S subunit
MKSSYKPIGDYIQKVEKRNSDLKITRLLGLSMTKEFRESTSNIIGTDMSVYKVMSKYQFACDFMSPIRVNKLPVVLKLDDEPNIVSPAYPVFEITDRTKLDPEYLMMWFRRSEFDRYATFKCDAAIRGGYEWKELCETLIPVPSITKQKEVVKEYNVVRNRILLNQQLIQKLEETAQAIYKQWFVDFEFPDENGKHYKSNGGEMVWNEELQKEIPKGWSAGALGDCITFANGYGFESDDLLDVEVNDCFSVFKMGNIHKGGGFKINGTKSWIEKGKCKDLTRFVLKKGDLLMCMTDMKENIGLLGNTALMTLNDKFILNQRVGLLRVNNEIGVSYRYLYLITNSTSFLQDLRSRANRGVQVNLTKNEIVSSKIILAEYKTNIAFDNILKSLYSKIEIAADDIQVSEKISNLLLSKLAAAAN